MHRLVVVRIAIPVLLIAYHFLTLVGSFDDTMNIARTIAFGVKGYFQFCESGFLANKARFNETETAVDLSEEYVMITGANSGIGKQAALDVAKKGATVYLVCRNQERGEAARQEIVEATKNEKVHLLLCDLSSPQESLKFARSFIESKKPLTTLCANAGVLLNEFKLIDGKYEAIFATNTLSVHVFVRELVPYLETVPNSKVLITTSGGALPSKLDIEAQDISPPKKFDGTVVYSQTKRQEIEMAEHYAREHPKVFFASWHPGWVDTPGVETSLPDFYKKFKNKLRTTEQGADTLVWLVCLRNALDRYKNGEFFFDREVTAKHFSWGGTHVSEETVAKFIDKLDEFYNNEKTVLHEK